MSAMARGKTVELARIMDIDLGVSGPNVFGVPLFVREILGTSFASEDLRG